MKVHIQQRGTVLLPGSIFSKKELKILSVRNESILKSGCSLPVFQVMESYVPEKQREVHAKIMEPKQACKTTIHMLKLQFKWFRIRYQLQMEERSTPPHIFGRKSHISYLLNSVHIKKYPGHFSHIITVKRANTLHPICHWTTVTTLYIWIRFHAQILYSKCITIMAYAGNAEYKNVIQWTLDTKRMESYKPYIKSPIDTNKMQNTTLIRILPSHVMSISTNSLIMCIVINICILYIHS